MKNLVAAFAVLLVAGCTAANTFDASARQIAGGATIPLGDGNSNFFARDGFEGFTLTVNYLHPLAGASNQVVLTGCRQALDLAAIRASQQRGRFINAIDNRTVNVRTQPSVDRPGLVQCTMTAPVRYAS